MSLISAPEYRLRALLPEYRRLEQRLLATLERELDDRCYVSFSAGKDSSVVAHACHAVRPGIPILMVDPGVPVHWTAEDRDRWIEYAGQAVWNLTRFPWDKFARHREATYVQSYRSSIHAEMFHDLTEYAGARGSPRRVMGLRAEESRGRRLSLGSDRGSSEKRLCPISLWRVQDVWTYIVSHGLPWLSIYDYLGPAARNGLIGRNGVEQGRLEYLRRYYPEVWRTVRWVGGEMSVTG